MHLNILSNDIGNIEEFEQSLSQFIAYMNEMSVKGYSIEFLYGAQNYPSKDDREFIAFIEPRLTCKWSVTTAKSLDEWLGCIEKASLLVSRRFHHSIAAACLGTPFIALNSNTPKIDSLLKALNYKSVINYSGNNLFIKLLNITDQLKHETGDTKLDELCYNATQNFISLRDLIIAPCLKEIEEVSKSNS